MNHEFEAYPGELRELRKSHDLLLDVFIEGRCSNAMMAQIKAHHEGTETKAFTWHKLLCNQCGINADLLQRNDGQVMCRQCYNDHFEETEGSEE